MKLFSRPWTTKLSASFNSNLEWEEEIYSITLFEKKNSSPRINKLQVVVKI